MSLKALSFGRTSAPSLKFPPKFGLKSPQYFTDCFEKFSADVVNLAAYLEEIFSYISSFEVIARKFHKVF